MRLRPRSFEVNGRRATIGPSAFGGANGFKSRYSIPVTRHSSIYCLILASGCSLADLRPETMVNDELAPQAEQVGRAWLSKAVAAQGGTALTTKQTLSLWVRDDWPSTMMRWMAMPWETNKQLLRLDIALGTDNGRLTFLEGEQTDAGWGLQNWVTYDFDKTKVPRFDNPDAVDGTTKFWIPTLAYFPLLAWRIQEADVVRFIGTEHIGDRELAKVFASWGQAAPQDTVDQYIVWIDTSTNLIAGAQFTVRDMMGGSSVR